MGGIYLMLVIVSWLLIVFASTGLLVKLLPEVWRTYVVRGILFLAVLPLPLIDELIGKQQFENLCSENATVRIDDARAAGKTVYLARSHDLKVNGTWVPIVKKPWRFVDSSTGETVVSYTTLMARGGLVARALGVSEGDTPLLFRGSCAPPNPPGSAESFAELGINYVEPPVHGDTR